MTEQLDLAAAADDEMERPKVPSNLGVPTAWSRPFGELYCEVMGCSRQDFVLHMFWRGMQRHALPFALVLIRMKPEFFKEDLEAIREIGLARNSGEFNHDVNLLHARNLRHGGFLRRVLGVRVSGKRLIRLKAKVLEQAG